MRLKDKTAIIVGAGQSPGSGMGNGRATCLRFAQEGAKVMAVERTLALAEETAVLVRQAGGDCFAFEADVTREAALAAMVAEAKARWGRIDILHYNVGVSLAGGDAPLAEITEAAFDNVILPGLMDTPMAVDTRARKSGKPRAEIAAARDARVPLRRKMGTAWDVANAALFLASDEANFITGVDLLVDGGGALNTG
jgi:NAD(P)-dependent dehydrogenase (short-subunit alcohol dehydrogenase family)